MTNKPKAIRSFQPTIRFEVGEKKQRAKLQCPEHEVLPGLLNGSSSNESYWNEKTGKTFVFSKDKYDYSPENKNGNREIMITESYMEYNPQTGKTTTKNEEIIVEVTQEKKTKTKNVKVEQMKLDEEGKAVRDKEGKVVTEKVKRPYTYTKKEAQGVEKSRTLTVEESIDDTSHRKTVYIESNGEPGFQADEKVSSTVEKGKL